MLNPLQPLINKPFVHTLVLLRTPKCASSTLKAATAHKNLLEREKKLLTQKLGNSPVYKGLFCPTHATPPELFSIFGRGILNFFSFSCVRNPFDRQVSMWSFSNGKNFGDYYGEKNCGTFKDFLELCYKKYKAKDPHFIGIHPQTLWTHNPVFQARHVLRFETLQQDWSDMIREYGIYGVADKLPHENKSEHKDWREYYGETEKAIVEEIFAPDFEILDYSRKF